LPVEEGDGALDVGLNRHDGPPLPSRYSTRK